jgi:aminoglycoside/choline kinase family phosphotransferase
MSSVAENDDPRKRALDDWAGRQLGQPLTGEPVSVDASFRRYYRYNVDGRSLIGMDAPPEQEDSEAFVRVDKLLAEAGVHVPGIVAVDLDAGFMLLSDLGNRTWLQVLNEGNADDYFDRAMDALVTLQQASRPGVLPHYDEALLRRELALFPDWYLARELELTPDDNLRRDLDELFDLLTEQALSQSKVWVHRDFMPRNLMDTDPNPGVIDFQDAVYGPVSYDPICLFKDAFISWPDETVQGWLTQYWEKAGEAGVPVPGSREQFLRDCDLMGAHRHLKVIGIFARICHRDGKPKYLKDVPRFFGYLREALSRREELAPLARVMEKIPTP